MKRFCSLLIVACLFAFVATPLAEAQRRASTRSSSSRSTSSPKPRTSSPSVTVRPYTRKNGTQVSGYTRRAPSSGRSATSPIPKPSTPRTITPRSRATTIPAPRSTAVAKPKTSTPNLPSAATTLPPRDKNGRFVRSESAKNAFMRQTGFSKGRPGYVVDHIIPLACGGADSPGNMQWQTAAAAKAKDKVERRGCREEAA